MRNTPHKICVYQTARAPGKFFHTIGPLSPQDKSSTVGHFEVPSNKVYNVDRLVVASEGKTAEKVREEIEGIIAS